MNSLVEFVTLDRVVIVATAAWAYTGTALRLRLLFSVHHIPREMVMVP
jgi:hypothetical protein